MQKLNKLTLANSLIIATESCLVGVTGGVLRGVVGPGVRCLTGDSSSEDSAESGDRSRVGWLRRKVRRGLNTG